MTKPYRSDSELLELLASRGMIINEQAERWLKVVTYYRLSGYAYLYRIPHDDDSLPPRGERFVEGTAFSHVASLYEFDRKLRTLLFDGLERVEVVLRRGLAEVVGKKHPMAYRDPNHFRDNFDHKKWLKTVDRRLERAKDRDAAIKHHFKKYGGECPIWVVVDALDFMDVSHLYEGLRIQDQFRVAETMGIGISTSKLSRNQRSKVLSDHPVARWLEQATVARNICAHHGRLWNRGLVPANATAMRTVPQLAALPQGQSSTVFGLLTFVAGVLHTTSPGSQWATRVRLLIDGDLAAIPGRAAHEIGAPDDWRELEPWVL